MRRVESIVESIADHTDKGMTGQAEMGRGVGGWGGLGHSGEEEKRERP